MMAVIAFKPCLAMTEIDKYNFSLEKTDPWSYIEATDGDRPPYELSSPRWQPYLKSLQLSKHKQYWFKNELSNILPVARAINLSIEPKLFKHARVYVYKQGRLIEKHDLAGSIFYLNNSSVNVHIPPEQKRTILILLDSPYLSPTKFLIRDFKTAQKSLVQKSSVNALMIGALLIIALVILVYGVMQPFRLAKWLGLSNVFLALLLAKWLGFFNIQDSTFSLWWSQWSLVLFSSLSLGLLQRGIAKERLPFPWQSKLINLFSMFTFLYIPIALFLPLNFFLILFLYTATFLILAPTITLVRHSRSVKNWLILIQPIKLVLLIFWSTLGLNTFPNEASLVSFISLSLIADLIIFILILKSRPSALRENQRPSTGQGIPTERKQDDRRKEDLGGNQTDLLNEFKIASLGTLTNGLAHELNNPVAIIEGHQYRLTSMVRSKNLNITQVKKSLEKIGLSVTRVLSVIDALKAYSQESRTQETPGSFSIRETVQFALDLSRERLNSLGVKLTTQPIPDTYIECNQSQIMQAILILIDNAQDAVRDQNVKTISVEFKQSVTMLELFVIDNGPGIPIANRQRIFDPFFTGSATDQRKGLGLSVATGIINKHNGEIYLKSSHPQTCFVIRLPR